MQQLIKSLLKDNSLLLAILVTIVIIFLSLIRIGKQPINFNHLDKIEHCIAYATLSFLWLLSLGNTKRRKIIICIMCMLFGMFIEVLQDTTSYRTFDYVDMFANSIGVLIGFIMFIFFVKYDKLTN